MYIVHVRVHVQVASKMSQYTHIIENIMNLLAKRIGQQTYKCTVYAPYMYMYRYVRLSQRAMP